jgi:predicted  nucleic acid-binding Zn-ribbon protein
MHPNFHAAAALLKAKIPTDPEEADIWAAEQVDDLLPLEEALEAVTNALEALKESLLAVGEAAEAEGEAIESCATAKEEYETERANRSDAVKSGGLDKDERAELKAAVDGAKDAWEEAKEAIDDAETERENARDEMVEKVGDLEVALTELGIDISAKV